MRAVLSVMREIVIAGIIKLFAKSDVVRHETLELTAAEVILKKVRGCVAELGVYKGDFARRIHDAFPDRKLFLFDTFSGFDERDVKIEVEQGCKPHKGDFTNRSIEKVLKKMKRRENCIVKKGWFPQTAEDVDETFAFVSIDVDLSEPIYQGLIFFYPRLEKGGYIFVHDYGHSEGIYAAQEAVRKFSDEYNVPYVPLSDVCGSVVFSK